MFYVIVIMDENSYEWKYQKEQLLYLFPEHDVTEPLILLDL